MHVPARRAADVLALERLRKNALQAPSDLPAALALTRSYIEASRRDGDPRYLGAAEAALAPWTAGPEPSPDVRLLHATILQARHEFDAALVQLDQLLAVRPDDAQGLLTRATVLMVKGDYERARASCRELEPLVSRSYAIACLAPIDTITGHGQAALAALAQAEQTARSREELAWLHSLSGEQAFWLGDAASSEKHLEAALALDAGDRYTRAVYTDLLLDEGRLDDARALVRDRTSDDALALRAALIELAAGQKDASQVARVKESFAASRLRGDSVHRREEARLWLAAGEPARALRCALESWSVQHEPWDARLVLEAAVAAKQPGQAAPVLAWLAATNFEAPRLRALANKLGARP